jgi:hypothetical protein
MLTEASTIVKIVGTLSIPEMEGCWPLHDCLDQQGGINHCQTMCLRARLSLLHHRHDCGDFVLLRSSILPRWIYDAVRTGSVPFPLLFELGAGAGVYLEVELVVGGCLAS